MLKKWYTPDLTFDTNTVIAKDHNPDVDKLFEMNGKEEVKIFKTDVVDTELSKKSREKSATLHEDLGVARIGHSRIGHAVIGGESDVSESDRMMEIIFPETKGEKPNAKKVRDVMHLLTHKKHNRDIFVTNDRDFITKKEELKSEFGIVVMTPQECVQHIIEKNIMK